MSTVLRECIAQSAVVEVCSFVDPQEIPLGLTANVSGGLTTCICRAGGQIWLFASRLASDYEHSVAFI